MAKALEQVGTCSLHLMSLSRIVKRWPCYGRAGQFCLTPPPHWNTRKPDLKREWFSVTHQPTGMRAGDVLADDPRAMAKLAKFARMFGRATTVKGVMRKYKALPTRHKRWIAQQKSWLLSSKEAR